jgi:branched-chain amino acid transport system permease protein
LLPPTPNPSPPLASLVGGGERPVRRVHPQYLAMTLSGLLFQALDGLAAASGLFFVAAGLSLIFGVTRIINMAHGSLYMLGAYGAATLAGAMGGAVGFWAGILVAALAVGVVGALVEVMLLRRIYRAPELLQLLATFALVLIIGDAALWLWGPEDLLGPRAPGLRGAVEFLGRRLPTYDLFLIAAGPLALLGLYSVLVRTRFGRLIRAATQDREMLGALGVNQKLLFTAVFAVGSVLAGLGGALQIAREPANLSMDLAVISDAFVVVVVGGMGSIAGSYLAAVLVAEAKALCISAGLVSLAGVSVNMSKLTLVAEFLVMAVVLIVRPHGLLGSTSTQARTLGQAESPLRPGGVGMKVGAVVLAIALALMPLGSRAFPYALVLGIDVLIAVMFATSLHFIMGPGGMPSFGHAAYFGLGAYAAALLVKWLGLSLPTALVCAPIAAFLGALLFGWFAVRLSGIYLAMLTLAFAQIVWSIVFQWNDLTGGSNGILGIWPTPPFDSRAALFALTAALAAAGVLLLRRVLFAPFGYAMRAGRDSSLRAEAIGIDVKRVQWIGFAIAGGVGGVAGGMFAFAKGSISPESIEVSRSIDGLVMVLLGGVGTLAGPIVGAAAFATLADTVMRQTAYWHALLGAIILLLVLVFPSGIVGGLAGVAARVRGRS